MKAIANFDSIRPATSDFVIPVGGFVCQIRDVKDDEANSRLIIEYDIVEGEFKNYAASTEERAGFWPLSFVKSYSNKAAAFFKTFTMAVEETNKGYKWAWDDQSLVNKGIGLVLGEKEYRKNNGNIGVKPYVDTITTAAAIRAGKFKEAERIPLKEETGNTSNKESGKLSELDDDTELPF